MTEENNDDVQALEPPVFRLQKMYLKDLSFENPEAPDVFLAKGEPMVDVNLGLKHKQLETEDHYEVTLAITAKVTNNQTEKTLFIIEVEHAGVFLLKNIPEEHMPAVLSVECASLLFPFTRQIISQVSVDGGFVPFLMEPINFHALYENSKRQKESQEQAQ
ncbi:MAG: protein-export chaperone SecB [Deltaproteobacteria bacterium RIFOXYD12_FULL_55_16]|nr:MAG: protein-export chaperone SecB [Deltaproteobacteria bacterium RIFOXYD12_FULL_55_16]